MSGVICVHFSQLVDCCGNRHPPHYTIERLYAKMLIRALERQVSQVDNYGEVVNHQCHLAYASVETFPYPFTCWYSQWCILPAFCEAIFFRGLSMDGDLLIVNPKSTLRKKWFLKWLMETFNGLDWHFDKWPLLSFWRINVSICVYFKTLPRHAL